MLLPRQEFGPGMAARASSFVTGMDLCVDGGFLAQTI
jgi:hypothetical protein